MNLSVRPCMWHIVCKINKGMKVCDPRDTYKSQLDRLDIY